MAVAVQATIPLLVSTSNVPTNRQLMVVAISKPLYTLVAMQVMLVPTAQRNVTSGGRVPPVGRMGPELIGTQASVIHAVLSCILLDEIFWHPGKLRLRVSEQLVRA